MVSYLQRNLLLTNGTNWNIAVFQALTMHAINRCGVKKCCVIRQHHKASRYVHVIGENATVVVVNVVVRKVVGVKLEEADLSQVLIDILPIETCLTKCSHIYFPTIHWGVKGMVTI